MKMCNLKLWGQVVCTGVLLSAFGCSGPAASQGGFDSDNPAAQLYAIRHAGQSRDRSAMPQLVEFLESDDPAVRMMSIRALEQITGERLGYNPYGSVDQRREAVDRWESAMRNGRFAQSE